MKVTIDSDVAVTLLEVLMTDKQLTANEYDKVVAALRNSCAAAEAKTRESAQGVEQDERVFAPIHPRLERLPC